MDSVSSSQHDSWVSKANVPPAQTRQKLYFRLWSSLRSHRTSHSLWSWVTAWEGGIKVLRSKSYYRKSMRDGQLLWPSLGHRVCYTPTQTLTNWVSCSLSGIISHHGLLTGCVPAIPLPDAGILQLSSHFPPCICPGSSSHLCLLLLITTVSPHCQFFLIKVFLYMPFTLLPLRQ